MLTKLKKRVQAMLATEAKAAHKIGLTPNKLSATGIVLAFLSAIAYTLWQTHTFYLLLAAVLLLLSGFCDALDGILARLYHETTPFGGFLDSLLDRYADATVYAGIIISELCNPLWGLTALIGSLLVSYTRARAEATHTSHSNRNSSFLATKNSNERWHNPACSTFKPDSSAKKPTRLQKTKKLKSTFFSVAFSDAYAARF